MFICFISWRIDFHLTFDQVNVALFPKRDCSQLRERLLLARLVPGLENTAIPEEETSLQVFPTSLCFSLLHQPMLRCGWCRSEELLAAPQTPRRPPQPRLPPRDCCSDPVQAVSQGRVLPGSPLRSQPWCPRHPGRQCDSVRHRVEVRELQFRLRRALK